MQNLAEHDGAVPRYKGSNGHLKVSARHLDEKLSTEEVPAHSFDKVENQKLVM